MITANLTRVVAAEQIVDLIMKLQGLSLHSHQIGFTPSGEVASSPDGEGLALVIVRWGMPENFHSSAERAGAIRYMDRGWLRGREENQLIQFVGGLHVGLEPTGAPTKGGQTMGLWDQPCGWSAAKLISLDNGNTFTDALTVPEAELIRLWDQIINLMECDAAEDAYRNLADRGVPESNRRIFLETYLKLACDDLVVG